MVATALATLPPGDHTDPATSGLQLRVRAKQDKTFSRTWLLRYRWRDEWVRLTLGHYPGMSLVEARESALKLRKAMDEGIDPRRARPRRAPRVAAVPLSAAPADQHTVEYLASEFMERYVRRERKRPEYVDRILRKDILTAWKGRDVRTVTTREVIVLLDGIVDRGSPVAANRTAAVIGQMFKFGIQRGLLDTSPVQLLYRPGGKEPPRSRVLTDDELRALLANPIGATRFERLAQVITILLYTGQRRGELAAAKWPDIDFTAATWTIPPENSKTGREHVVPLTDPVLTILRALKAQSGRSRYVLPGADPAQPVDPKLLTRSLARCQERMQKLGIVPFTLHDLRRTCRTGLARLGVEPHIAERVIGHAQEKLATTYDLHAYADEKREALEKWAAHLQGLTR